MPFSGRSVPSCLLPSHTSGLDDLALDLVLAAQDRLGLELDPGWTSQWTVRFKKNTDEWSCTVADFPGRAAGLEPVRHFGWSRRQAQQPSKQNKESTGRQHGFES